MRIPSSCGEKTRDGFVLLFNLGLESSFCPAFKVDIAMDLKPFVAQPGARRRDTKKKATPKSRLSRFQSKIFA
jgi:hypothetical protein